MEIPTEIYPRGKRGWRRNVSCKRSWGPRGKKNHHRKEYGELKPDGEFPGCYPYGGSSYCVHSMKFGENRGELIWRRKKGENLTGS